MAALLKPHRRTPSPDARADFSDPPGPCPLRAGLLFRRRPRSSALAGLIAIRRQGIYFAVITLALAQMQMMCLVAVRAKLTGGEDGIQRRSRGQLFGMFDLNNEMMMYAFVLIVVLAALFLVYRIINSPFGGVLSRRSARTSSVPFRSAIAPTAISSLPSCYRRRLRDWSDR